MWVAWGNRRDRDPRVCATSVVYEKGEVARGLRSARRSVEDEYCTTLEFVRSRIRYREGRAQDFRYARNWTTFLGTQTLRGTVACIPQYARPSRRWGFERPGSSTELRASFHNVMARRPSGSDNE